MRTLVRFRAGNSAFAIPVESTTGVRTVEGLVDLPGCRDDVVGMLPGEPSITVLSTLGCGRSHILVLDVDGIPFGLHVQEVIGVLGVAEIDIGPPPLGQDHAFVGGTVRLAGDLILIADPHALAGRL